MIAADYPFLDVMWTMFVFFIWVIWIWMLFAILGDVFRRRDLSGGGKTGWCIFLICVPFLAVFVYLIKHSDDMAQRNIDQVMARQAEFDEHVRTVAAQSGGAASEIEKAQKLLASKAITQAEFDALKAQALAV